MVFQWFWQSWTITIECFLGGPTIGTNGFSMVFKILRAMVNNGFEVNDGVPGQDHITKWWWYHIKIFQRAVKNKITPWDILNYSLQNIFFKGIEVDIAGVQKSEETIANFQWFLRRPSPLNVFGRSDHCHQWFYDGFLMLLPSLSMVFDGSRPLVKRCDGFDGSLWSNAGTQLVQC